MQILAYARLVWKAKRRKKKAEGREKEEKEDGGWTIDEARAQPLPTREFVFTRICRFGAGLAVALW